MVCKEPSSAEAREPRLKGSSGIRRKAQGAKIARTDALSGAGIAALVLALLLLALALWRVL